MNSAVEHQRTALKSRTSASHTVPGWGNLLLGAAIILLATPGSLAGAAAVRPNANTKATGNHANERGIWVMWILSFMKDFVGPSAAQPEPGRRLIWPAYFPLGLKSARLVPAAAWMPPSRCFRNSGSV